MFPQQGHQSQTSESNNFTTDQASAYSSQLFSRSYATMHPATTASMFTANHEDSGYPEEMPKDSHSFAHNCGKPEDEVHNAISNSFASLNSPTSQFNFVRSWIAQHNHHQQHPSGEGGLPSPGGGEEPGYGVGGYMGATGSTDATGSALGHFGGLLDPAMGFGQIPAAAAVAGSRFSMFATGHPSIFPRYTPLIPISKSICSIESHLLTIS